MSESLPSAENCPIYIAKSKKKNGATQYLVVEANKTPNSGIWVKDNNPKFKNLIDQYEDDLKNKKKSTRRVSTGHPRRIQKIAGIMVNDNERVFVVKFTDNDVFEQVTHSDMRSRYTKSLLAFYEHHIHLLDEEK